jgi:xylulokinase
MGRTISATVVGIDSSTQSTKVVVCDARTGAVRAEGRAPHPEGTEVDPRHWWDALQRAGDGLLNDVDAIAVAGQQHGMVALDEQGAVIRPALLWNDTRSAQAALDLIADLGGRRAWSDAVGLVPVASFTVTKLRWLAEHEPANAERVHDVVLPHDWLTAKLSTGSELVTDRGDASGTGYWSPREERYREDLLTLSFGRPLGVPRVLGPSEAAGRTATGALLGPGTGDNMAAALGLGAVPGDVVVSLGTSGTVFAVSTAPTEDARGLVAGFADATGRHLPLVATLNAARVLSAAAALLGTDLDGLDRLALEAAPGAQGLVLLPYLDGERTPNLPNATGSLLGLERSNLTPANLARAAVEGMLSGLADGVEAVRAAGVPVRRVILIGGAARSQAVRTVAPTVLGLPVVVPPSAEYVALGAARQAAWVLGGGAEPPHWELEGGTTLEQVDAAAHVRIRDAYVAARQERHGV